MAAMVMDVTDMADMAMENPVMVTDTEKLMSKDIPEALEMLVLEMQAFSNKHFFTKMFI